MVVLLALLQLGASTLFVVADALLDREHARSTLHIESEGSEECQTDHDHLFCQVVRSLGAATGADASCTVDTGIPEADARIESYRSDFVPSPRPPGVTGPRGPPLL